MKSENVDFVQIAVEPSRLLVEVCGMNADQHPLNTQALIINTSLTPGGFNRIIIKKKIQSNDAALAGLPISAADNPVADQVESVFVLF